MIRSLRDWLTDQAAHLTRPALRSVLLPIAITVHIPEITLHIDIDR